MLKRTPTILLLVAAVFMFFLVTEVMAQCVPDSCIVGPWTITFQGVVPTTCKDVKYVNGTKTVSDVTCYKFNYQIEGPTSGFNQANALIPVCCGNPIQIYPDCLEPPTYSCNSDTANGDFGDSPSKIFDPAVGDSTTKFGVGNYQDFVIRSEPTGGFLPTPHIFSSSPVTASTTIQIKSGKNVYYCQNIAAPACAEPGFIPVNLSARIKLGPGEVCVTKDPTTGCINDVYECDGSYHYPLTAIQNFQVAGSALQWAGADSEQRCPTVILYTESSMPRCYPLLSGGSGCQKCYCCTNAQCANKGYTTCVGKSATCSEAAGGWGSCQ